MTAFFLVLAACSADSPVPERSVGNGPRRVTPAAAENIRLSGQDALEQAPSREETEPAVRVDLVPGSLVADVLETNLNGNNFEEQIVAYLDSGGESGTIEVAVIENDIVDSGYQLVWTAPTLATNLRGLRVSAEDVTGNFEPEIIVSGVDDDGRETMNVFSRADDSTELQYVEIASITSTGTIEIERSSRGEEYNLREQRADPYVIIAQAEDPDSENVLDLIETRYEVSPSEGAYVQVDERRISGGVVEQNQLQILFRSGSDAFAEFLSGPWYRETGEGLSIVTFDTRGEQVVFNGGDMQESFDWELSRKTISSGVQLMLRNRNIRSMNTFVRVRVRALDQIVVDLHDRSRWDGTYRRVSSSLLTTLTQADEGRIEPAPLELSGTYTDDSGVDIHFRGERFELTEDEERLQGTASVYRIPEDDRYVLELVIFDQSARRNGRRVYTFEHDITSHSDRIVRTLELQPARLTVNGVSSAPGSRLLLEQIELAGSD
ncbi:MAG: pallilysin-related adhesin [bacterium]